MSVTKNITRANDSWADILADMADVHTAIDTTNHRHVFRDGSNFYPSISYKHWNGAAFVFDAVDDILVEDGFTLGLGAGKATLTLNDATTDNVILTNANLAIGAVTPDTLLHIWDSSAGTVTALAGTLLTLEKGGDHADIDNFISFLITTPNEGYTTRAGLIMGDDGDNDACSIIYSNISGTSTHLAFTVAGAERFTINSNGCVSIGAVAPDSLLHVWNATAGNVTAFPETLLTIENDDNAYISFLTGNARTAGIIFGDADSNFKGWIYYDHNTDTLGFVSNGASLLFTSTDFMAQGTVNIVVLNGNIGLSHGSTQSTAFEGAITIDHDASTHGDLICYHDGAWRKVVSLP